MGDTASRRVKIAVTEEEHDRIRVSAALMKTTMTDFCRRVVVATAEEATRDIMPVRSSNKDRKPASSAEK